MNAGILHELHATAGARLLEPEQGGALLTYGDVPAEYEAATRACVLFDQTGRGCVRARGAEAGAFLQRLLANDVLALAPSQVARNLLLSPKGKVRFDFDLARIGDEYLLSTAPGEGASLLVALDTYLFTEQVELSDESDAHAPLCVLGPDSSALVERALDVAAPREDLRVTAARFEGGALSIATMVQFGSRALRLDAGPERAPALWTALREAGARPAGRVVADILRVEAGAAQSPDDLDETVYPQEARLERAFSLEKGCYIGQEVVAKIDTYGGLNKRLVALRVSHDDPVARGTRLHRRDEERDEWRDVGVVTSWAYSFVLDTGLVLAFVKRRHQAAGTRFRLADGPAEATVVPLPVRPGAVPPTGVFE